MKLFNWLNNFNSRRPRKVTNRKDIRHARRDMVHRLWGTYDVAPMAEQLEDKTLLAAFWQDNFEATMPDLAAGGSNRNAMGHTSTTDGQQGAGDYSVRDIPGSDLGKGFGQAFTGHDGSEVWRFEDMDGMGLSNPAEIEWTGIDISGRSNLLFAGLFGARFGGFLEVGDFMTVAVNVDSGGYTNILDFQHSGGNVEETVSGTDLTLAMQEFTASVSAGNSLDIRIRFFSDGGGDEMAFDNFRIGDNNDASIATGPEIAVTGDGMDITDGGGNTPSAATDTDFDSAEVTGEFVERTFTINNTGGSTLNLEATEADRVTLSGAGASHFTVTDFPAATIADSSSDTFTIRFDPSAVGMHDALVTIQNDDADEDPFTFDITGEGLADTTVFWQDDFEGTSPEFPAGGSNRNAMGHTSTTDGQQGTGDHSVRDIPGTDAGKGFGQAFTNFSDTLVWRFEDIDGMGLSNPGEIEWTGIDITGITGLKFEGLFGARFGGFLEAGDFMTVAVNVDSGGYSDILDFQHSGGNVEETVSGIDLTTAMQEFEVPVAAGNDLDLRVRFFSDGGGDEMAFDNFRLRGVLPVVPEINVSGDGVNIPDDDVTPSTTDDTDFGQAQIGGETQVHTFTITNTGNAALDLTGSPLVDITGTGASHFSVSMQPNNDPVSASGGTSVFEVTFDPSAIGTHNATIEIANDDSDENPFNYNITGEGIPDAPEISVEGNSTDITDGDTTPDTADDTDFGDVMLGSTDSHTFTITNSGFATLNLDNGGPQVVIGGTHASDFTVTSDASTTVSTNGGTTTFTIEFAPSGTGLRTADVTIQNNDSDEDPFNFDISGQGRLTPFWTDDFEATGPTQGDRDASNHANGDNGTDFGGGEHFVRTNNASLGSTETFTNIQDSFYWAVENLTGGSGTDPDLINWTGITITGRENLLFQGYFGAEDNNLFDAADQISVEADIDGGGFTEILRFESDASGQLLQDTDFDGTGDGIGLTENLIPFTAPISGTGDMLSLRITVTDTNASEEIAFDHFTLEGNTTATTDVVLTGGNLTITDTGGGDTDDTLTIEVDGSNLRVSDPNQNLGAGMGATQDGANDVLVPLDSITGTITINTLGGDDSLTVDFGGGNFDRTDSSTIEIFYNGGTQTGGGGDDLTIQGGGTFALAEFTFDSLNDGSIDITGNNTINYTGLEPISSTITATNVTLNYSTAAETITVSASGSQTEVDSTVGEVVTFNNPTGTLTINPGATGGNTINVQGVGSGFDAGLTINNNGATDDVVFQTATTNIGSGDFDITSTSLQVNATAQTTGSFTADITNNITDNGSGSLTAASVDLTAGGNIGSGANSVNTDTDDLTTDTSGGNGSQWIEDAGSLTALDLSAGMGDVNLIVTGSVTDSDGDVDVDAPDGRLTIDATSGIGSGGTGPIHTTIDSLDLQNSSSGVADILETDDLDIFDFEMLGSTSGGASTVAGSITILNAGNGVTSRNGVRIDANGGSLNVNQTVTQTVGGLIRLLADDDVIFSADGDVSNSGAGITVTADNNGDANGSGGELMMADGTEIDAGGGSLSLNADEDITLGRVFTTRNATDAVVITSTSGAVVDGGNTGGADIGSGDGAVIRAASGIGSGAALETAISTLAALNSTSGNIEIDNSVGGLLTIGTGDGLSGVTNNGGTIVITNASPLTVSDDVDASGDITLTAIDSSSPGDDLTVVGSVSVHSTGGNVTLQAGDNLIINPGPTIEANGQVTIEGDFGDADGGTGSIIAFQGILITGTTADILGEADDDNITFDPSSGSTGGVRIDGAGGNDRYNVDLGNLAGQVDIDDQAGEGTDELVVTGVLTGDVLDVDASRVMETNTGETVTYTAGLESLDVFTRNADDTITVTPSMTLQIDIIGGSHTLGDTLNFLTPPGQTVTLAPSVPPGPDSGILQTSGGFQDVNFDEIENLNIGGDITVDGSGDDDLIVITATGADSGTFQVTTDVDGSGSGPIVGPVINFALATGITVNGLGEDDLIRINQAGGILDPTNGITINGNAGADSVELVDGTTTSIEFGYITNNDGTIGYDGEVIPTISYFGLAPISSTINASDVTLNYSGASDIINVNNNSGQTEVDSNVGEITTFNNPSNSLTINAGGGSDAIILNSLGAGFDADLIVNGGSGVDILGINGSVDGGSGRIDIGLMSDVNRIVFGAAGDLTTTGNVNLGAGIGAGIGVENFNTGAAITADNLSITSDGAIGSAIAPLTTSVNTLTTDTSANDSDQDIDDRNPGGIQGIDILGGSSGTFTFSSLGDIQDSDPGIDIGIGNASIVLGGAFGSMSDRIQTAVNDLQVISPFGNQWGAELDGLTGLELDADTNNANWNFGGTVNDTDAGIDIIGDTGTFTFSSPGNFGSGSDSIQTGVLSLNVDSSAGPGGGQWIDLGPGGVGQLNLNSGSASTGINVDSGGPIADSDAGIDIIGTSGTFTFSLGTAGDNFGTMANRIQTQVSDLSVDTFATSGNQWIDAVGGLTSFDLDANTDGSIDITSNASITDGEVITDLRAGTAVFTFSGATSNLGSGGSLIDMQVDDLTVDTSDGGSQWVRVNGLTALDLDAGAGDVTVESNQSVTDTDTGIDILSDTATFTFTSNGNFGAGGNPIGTDVDSLNVDTGMFNGSQWINENDGLTDLELDAGSGNITVDAGGTVQDMSQDGIDITGSTATFTFSTGNFGASGMDNEIDTAVDSLNVDTSTTGGSQWIGESDGLTDLNLDAGTGNIFLDATDGVEDSDIDSDITGTSASVTTGAGLGDTGPIDIDVDFFAFSNSGSGDVDVISDGGVTIDSVGPNATSSNSVGNVDIEADSPITFAVNTSASGNLTATATEDAGADTDDITVNGGVTVSVTGAGSVLTFNAGDDIIIQGGATVAATAINGDVTLNSGVADADGTGSQTLDGLIDGVGNSVLTINLNSQGAATQGAGGEISGHELLLLSSGSTAASFDLQAALNNVNNIAANVSGSIDFRDDNGVTITSVAGTPGITTGNGLVGPDVGQAVTIDSSQGGGGLINVLQAIDTTPPAAGGAGIITLSGAVTVGNTITAEGGNVTLLGGQGATADLTINDDLTSGGNLILEAPQDIIINAIVSTTGVGGITATADSDMNGSGGLLIRDAGQVDSNTGAFLSGSDGINALFNGAGEQAVEIDLDSGGAAQVTAVDDVFIEQTRPGVGLGNLIIDGAVETTGSGGNSDLVMSAANDILFGTGGDVTSVDGVIEILASFNPMTAMPTANLGQVVMSDAAGDTTVIDGNAGSVAIGANGNITLGQVEADTTGGTSLINIASNMGAIVDGGDTGTDVIGESVVLLSGATMVGMGGVGDDADALETQITNLAGGVNEGGDFVLDNTGELNITTVDLTGLFGLLVGLPGPPEMDFSGVGIDDDGGNTGGTDNITITAASPINVLDDVTNSDGGNITLTANAPGDLTISANVTAEGGNGSIDLNAGSNLIVDTAATVSTEGSGDIDGDATESVDISGMSTVQSVDGNITLNGNAGGAAVGTFAGITIADSTISTTNGAISLTGQGGDDAGSSNHHGILLQTGALIESTGTTASPGTITLVGTGGTGVDTNGGVTMSGVLTVTSVNADIDIMGQGATAGTGNENWGVLLSDSTVSSTGAGANAGTITIDGTGGTGVNNNAGVYLTQATVTSQDGDISLTGMANAGTTGTGNQGIRHAGNTGLIQSTGGTQITLDGTGGGGTMGNHGVHIFGDSLVEGLNGAIDITGAVGGSSDGVRLDMGGAIDALGTSTIDITGNKTGGGPDGVFINSEINSVTGTVNVDSPEENVHFGPMGLIDSDSGTVTIDADTNDNGTGSVVMDDMSLVDAGTGLIDVDADVDILLASLVTTGEVQATAAEGSIDDNGDADPDIHASAAALRAALGIGDDLDALETMGNGGTLTVSAETDSGDIHLDNTGSLIVGFVDGLPGVTITDGPVGPSNPALDSGDDNIELSAMSPLIVNNDVVNNDGGNILLEAIGGGPGDDVTLFANVTITGSNADPIDGIGDVTIEAGSDILQNAGDVTSDGAGAITYTANNGSPGGVITMADGTQATTDTGLIDFFAFGDITLGGLSTGNDFNLDDDAITAVLIESTDGGVVDGGPTHVEITANAVDAETDITAATGIGAGMGIGTSDDALEINVALLSTDVTATGETDLDEVDTINLNDVEATDGPIQVDAVGTITVTEINSTTDSDANDIALNSATGDITIDAIMAGPTMTDVLLNAAGAITEAGDAISTTEITADGVRFVTGGGAVGADGNPLETSINEVEAMTVGGGLFLENDQSIEVIDEDLTALAGRGNDDGGTTGISSAGDVELATTAGMVFLDETISAPGQRVAIDAAGGIRDNFSTASDGTNPAPPAGPITEDIDIDAADIALQAGPGGMGIGLMMDAIEIDATNHLAFDNNGGDIIIDDIAGGLVIDDVVAVDGSTITTSTNTGPGITTVRALSPLTVDHDVDSDGMVTLVAMDSMGGGDHLTVSSGVTVISNNAGVTLAAGDNLRLENDSTVDVGPGGAGVITLTVDTDQSGDADPGIGGLARLNGNIGTSTPGRFATLDGGVSDDTFIVQPQTPLTIPGDDDVIDHVITIDGHNGADFFRIHDNGLAGDTADGTGRTDGADIVIADSGVDNPFPGQLDEGPGGIPDPAGENSDRAVIYATSASDTIRVNNNIDNETVMPDTQTGGFVNNESTGERVNYTETLDRIEVNGGEFQGTPGLLDPNDDEDLFHVEPSTTVRILIHGNLIQFGPNPGDVPGTGPNVGDVLDFNSFDNRFQIIGKTIFTQNGDPTAFKGVSFRNIESMPLQPLGLVDAGGLYDHDVTGTTGLQEYHFDFDHPYDDMGGPAPVNTETGFTSFLPTQVYGFDDGLGGGPNQFGYRLSGTFDPRDPGFDAMDPAYQAFVAGFEVGSDDDGASVGSQLGDAFRDRHKFGEQTITVDIDNGWYLVAVGTGFVNSLRVTDADTGDILTADQTFDSGHSVFTFVVRVDDNTLDLTFKDSSGRDTPVQLDWMTIVPGEILSIGSPEPVPPTAPLFADGGTITDFTGFNADWTAGDPRVITISAGLDVDGDDIVDMDLDVVSPTGGSIDIDPDLEGVQVLADVQDVNDPTRARWSYSIVHPSTIGTGFVSFTQVDGRQTGCLSIDFVPPTSRRFDFNAFGTPTQAPVATDLTPAPAPPSPLLVGGVPTQGYLGVTEDDLFNELNPVTEEELGYGWDLFVSDGTSTQTGPQADLLSDRHLSANDRTFSTWLAPGDYTANVIIGPTLRTNVSVRTTGGTVPIVTDAVVSGLDGSQVVQGNFTVPDGDNQAHFDFSGVTSVWGVKGIEIYPQARIAGLVNIDTVNGNGPTEQLEGDGTTSDTIAITVPMGATITVDSSLGTFSGPDAIANIEGVQITDGGTGDTDATANGTITASLLRPTGTGFPTITAVNINGQGADSEATLIEYISPAIGAGARAFDFNYYGAGDTFGTFTGVAPNKVYDAATGFGYVGLTASANVPGAAGHPHASLIGDYHSKSSARIFRADLPAGIYEVTVIADSATTTITDDLPGSPNGVLGTITNTSGQSVTQTFNNYDTNGNDYAQLEFSGSWRINAVIFRLTQAAVGVTAPGGPLVADGMSTATFSIAGLTPGEVYNVNYSGVSGGTITHNAVMSADFDATGYTGAQIIAAAATATVDITHPGVPGTVTLTVEDATGASIGSDSVNFTFGAAGVRRFDFNSIGSPTNAGFTGVDPYDLFTATAGYGWNRTPGGTDAGSATIPNPAFVDLMRDSTSINGRTGVFQIATTPSTNHDLRIYQGNQFLSSSVEIFVEGAMVAIPDTAGGMFNSVDVLTVNSGADGIIDVSLRGAITHGTFGAFINGIDVAETASGLPTSALAPLMASSIGDGENVNTVTIEEVQAVADAAIAAFAAAGVNDADLARLDAVEFVVQDFSDSLLGLAQPNVIQIDLDGAGHGWFVDSTPGDDGEFLMSDPMNPGSSMGMGSDSDGPEGQMDLMTVVMHELGHVLGLDDLDPSVAPDSLMTGILETGTRRGIDSVDTLFGSLDLFDELD